VNVHQASNRLQAVAESVPGADKPYADKELIPEGFIAGKILVRKLPWTMF
jgi:hypothetical protein